MMEGGHAKKVGGHDSMTNAHKTNAHKTKD